MEISVQSFFAQLLLLIQEKFANDVPEVRWVDQDFGQLENYEERPAVLWPCVLVDFTTTSYDQMTNKEQLGLPTIQFRIGFNPYSNTSSSTPVPYREKALEYYELEDKIYQKFQGWDAGGLMQPITRTIGGTEKREDAIRVRLMNFTTMFTDKSAKEVTTMHVRPTPNFSFEQEG